MYNVIEYSDIFFKNISLWWYYRNEPALDGNTNVLDSPADNNNSISFKFEEKITGQTRNDGTEDVKISLFRKVL